MKREAASVPGFEFPTESVFVFNDRME